MTSTTQEAPSPGGAGERRGGFGVTYSVKLRRGEARASMVMDHGRFGPRGALGGVVGALAVNGLEQTVGRIREITRGVANIGNEAKRAGVSTKFFQELSHVAAQTRIPIDALVDGLKEMNLRGDEFALTGTMLIVAVYLGVLMWIGLVLRRPELLKVAGLKR